MSWDARSGRSLKLPGMTCGLPGAPGLTCSTLSPWPRPCAARTRCCIWPRASSRWTRCSQPGAWRENDRLRAEASALLVDAALAADVKAYVQPTVTFVYPGDRPVSEETPVGDVPVILRSALAAERQAARFARAGRRGVALRLGLLDGPGTGKDHPDPALGATLHAEDAGRALLAALDVASGVYNVCRDGERVSNRRFAEATGWHPQR